MTVTSIILDRTICSKIEYLYMERYRSGHNGADSKSCYFLQKLNIYYTEAYRSGHNELHSKCSSPQGLVGSNPTASAKNNPA